MGDLFCSQGVAKNEENNRVCDFSFPGKKKKKEKWRKKKIFYGS